MRKIYLACFLFLISGFLGLSAQEVTNKPVQEFKQKIVQKSSQKTVQKKQQKITSAKSKETLQKNKLAKELVDASRQGDLDTVRMLIKQGADINGIYTPPNTCNPMESGCSAPNSQTPLLAAGADANTKNNCGTSALKIAQKANQTEVVEILKQAGAKE